MKKMNIVTYYYFRREVLKINRSMHANKAVVHCFEYMQSNRYHARVAEVKDERTGELLAVITRRITGEINIIYKSTGIYVPETK